MLYMLTMPKKLSSKFKVDKTTLKVSAKRVRTKLITAAAKLPEIPTIINIVSCLVATQLKKRGYL